MVPGFGYSGIPAFRRRAALARGWLPSAGPPRGWGFPRTADFWGLAGRGGGGGGGRAPPVGGGGGGRGGPRSTHPWGLGGSFLAAHPRHHPTRPALDRFLRAPATKDKRKIQKQTPVASLWMPDFLLLICFPVAGQRHQAASTHGRADQRSAPTNSRVNLSEVGRCGLAGPQAPWMAPTSPHGRVYGVSCKPTPPRPTRSSPGPLLLWLWLWPLPWPLRVPGAARPKTLPPVPVQCRARFPTTVPRT